MRVLFGTVESIYTNSGRNRVLNIDGSLTARFARGAFAIPQITVTAVLLALCRAIRPAAALARGSTTAEGRAVTRPGHIGTTAAVIASDRRERAIQGMQWLMRCTAYQKLIRIVVYGTEDLFSSQWRRRVLLRRLPKDSGP